MLDGWSELGIAFALLLIFEGIMPFLNPSSWRRTLRTIIEFDDKTLRILGFSSMIVGLVLLYWIH